MLTIQNVEQVTQDVFAPIEGSMNPVHVASMSSSYQADRAVTISVNVTDAKACTENLEALRKTVSEFIQQTLKRANSAGLPVPTEIQTGEEHG